MKIVIANWKMNLSIGESVKFIKAVKIKNSEVVIAAPFTFLPGLAKLVKQQKIKLAGQNVCQFSEGAYTGEISAKMLKELACSYCLVGHSERRIYFKETDVQVNQKVINLLANKITPVICIGETADERKSGLTKQVLKTQLLGALKGIKNVPLIIAYEPVWAISTFQKGKNVQSAKLNDIISAHIFIKSLLSDYKAKIRVIYGGTVNSENCGEILRLKEVDGALVGGASLKVSSFNAIIQNT
jgi:triosephosphate isomerase